jgi:hypothetical protein
MDPWAQVVFSLIVMAFGFGLGWLYGRTEDEEKLKR